MSGQKNEFRYINFPLNMAIGLLSDEVTHKDAMWKIYAYGLANYALNKSISDMSLAQQAIYLYYQNALPNSLQKAVQKALDNGDLFFNEELRGFTSDGQNFEPETHEVEAMLNFIAAQKKEAASYLDWIKVSYEAKKNSIEQLLDTYFEVKTDQKNFTAKFGKDATVSLKIKLISDFYHDPPPPEMLSAYFALRSIQGRGKYTKTFKRTILLRMAGCKSEKVLNEISTPKLNEKIEHWGKRRNFAKILESLKNRGLITGQLKFEKTNFFLLSTSVTSKELAQLYAEAIMAEKRKDEEQEALELFNKLTSK